MIKIFPPEVTWGRKRTNWRARLWLTIIRFAWRRLDETRIPDGLPGVRDPLAPCRNYAPRKRRWYDSCGKCIGDGHYLCLECAYYVSEGKELHENPLGAI